MNTEATENFLLSHLVFVSCTGQPHHHPSHPDYVPSVFPTVYKKTATPDQSRVKRRCERCLHQQERHQLALDQQRQAEEEQYRNEVREEVMSRMEYLTAEGERLRAEYEESLRVEEEKKRKVEERLKAEEEKRMKAEQQRLQEERIRAELKQRRIEEEEKQEREEREAAEKLAAAELLIEFAAQIKEQETQTEGVETMEVCLQTECSAKSIEMLKGENEELKKQIQEMHFGVNVIQRSDQMTRFYTGLPWAVFLHIFCFLAPCTLRDPFKQTMP